MCHAMEESPRKPRVLPSKKAKMENEVSQDVHSKEGSFDATLYLKVRPLRAVILADKFSNIF